MPGRHDLRVGTAGWSIPKAYAASFPAAGSHLERYAAVLDAAEINTSFYRPHRRVTYERWAASVPEDFRFSVKVPKTVTHERRLVDCDDLLDRFQSEVEGLGTKLGPLLLQLPPSLSFSRDCEAFLERLRQRFVGAIVCEPRHPSWFDGEVDAVLAGHGIGRVAADPAVVPDAGRVGGWPGIAYVRLHGSPKLYWSAYDDAALADWRKMIAPYAATGDAWIVFDNTASGAALGNALRMTERRIA